MSTFLDFAVTLVLVIEGVPTVGLGGAGGAGFAEVVIVTTLDVAMIVPFWFSASTL